MAWDGRMGIQNPQPLRAGSITKGYRRRPAVGRNLQQGYDPCYSKDMAKVTSKLQLTVPKAIADQYGIKPGDELEWIPAGESIRVELVRRKAKAGHQLTVEERLALFDEGTKRLDALQAEELKKNQGKRVTRETRGWTRDDLYNDDRGLPRGFPR
jgi:AbrB family looped-hinge helix DNA binding protein